jgi:hypothetical protein
LTVTPRRAAMSAKGPTMPRAAGLPAQWLWSQIVHARIDSRFVAFLQVFGLQLPPKGCESHPLLYYRGRSRLGALSRMNRKKPQRKQSAQ